MIRSALKTPALITVVAFLGAIGIVGGGLNRTERLRARFWPPTGPIADRLASVSHANESRDATSALRDLIKAGAVIPDVGKGPALEVKSWLRQAHFDCAWSESRPSPTRGYTCRNDAAGLTENGCLRDWVVAFELEQREHPFPSIKDYRAEVRRVCR
jgi:hypothetical protein